MQKSMTACLTCCLVILLLTACSSHVRQPKAHRKVSSSAQQADSASLQTMGYAIQVGAFSNLENAVRLEQVLQRRGIDAYYFGHKSGLFKVRFGNHSNYAAARSEAEQLQSQGLIGSFFIVIPQSYSVAGMGGMDSDHLRENLVKTARGFIGVPYRWGGTDGESGFDCSGLTMVSYRLNGLNLPRVSYNQFQAGRWISKQHLRKGDLVFFATNGDNRVSHVGMYIGNNHFIHAPSTGNTIRIEKLSHPFYTRTYIGGRSYL
jgi:cell wall-associated NlpC family hydrolase